MNMEAAIVMLIALLAVSLFFNYVSVRVGMDIQENYDLVRKTPQEAKRTCE